MIRRESSTGRGLKDRQRYLDKIKHRISKSLPDVAADVPVIGGDGDQPVRLRVPRGGMTLPRFVPKRRSDEGFGQGDSQPGDIIARAPKGGQSGNQGNGEPGRESAEHGYDLEIEMTLAELRQWILEDLELPNLDDKFNDQLHEPEMSWTSISRVGSVTTLDKKETLKQSLARSLTQGRPFGFHPDDLRYKTWVERERPKTSAVIYFIRDVSASMDGERAYLARAVAWYLAAVIRSSYPICPIRFWVHDTDPQEVDETQFVTMSAGGGTAFSETFETVHRHMDIEYPDTSWNRYVFHFTDGEAWDIDYAYESLVRWIPSLSIFGTVFMDEPLWWVRRLRSLDQRVVRFAQASDRVKVRSAVRQLLTGEVPVG